jgi:hypothetical protein
MRPPNMRGPNWAALFRGVGRQGPAIVMVPLLTFIALLSIASPMANPGINLHVYFGLISEYAQSYRFIAAASYAVAIYFVFRRRHTLRTSLTLI